jgi:hypothetical protein
VSSSPPSFIRYFAQTDGSALGLAALEYLRSMLRVAPVRVVSMSGGLVGPWHKWADLQLTPLSGTYVNAVCCHPSRWTWVAEVPMTDADAAPGGAAKPTELAVGREELYTAKVRNVLFMVVPPTEDEQQKTAAKYERIVVPSVQVPMTLASRWPMRTMSASVIPLPIIAHQAVRDAILGEAS